MPTQFLPGGLSLERRLYWGGVVVAALFCAVFVGSPAAAQVQTPIAPTSPFAGPPIPSPSTPSPSRAAPTGTNQNQNANANPNAQIAPPDYRLGSGDRVHIIVFGQDELTGEYQVDGSGKLSFPLVGEIQAGGLTARELERAIRSALSPEYLKDPKVSAEVMAYRPFYILGEVKTPGSYSYVSGMTIINAVALAGGFTPRAKENNFDLARMGKDGRRAKVDASQDTPVQPGDVITVRERWF
jgi:polysaccharide export outer membrane protein